MPIISGNIHVKSGAPVPQELLDALKSPSSVISGNVTIEEGAIMPGINVIPIVVAPASRPVQWLTVAAAVLGIIAALIWIGR